MKGMRPPRALPRAVLGVALVILLLKVTVSPVSAEPLSGCGEMLPPWLEQLSWRL